MCVWLISACSVTMMLEYGEFSSISTFLTDNWLSRHTCHIVANCLLCQSRQEKQTCIHTYMSRNTHMQALYDSISLIKRFCSIRKPLYYEFFSPWLCRLPLNPKYRTTYAIDATADTDNNTSERLKMQQCVRRAAAERATQLIDACIVGLQQIRTHTHTYIHTSRD